MSAERTYNYAGNSMLASPVIVDADSLLFPMSTVENDQVVGNLQSINMVTGAVNWTFTAGTMFECTPAVNGGTIYIGNKDGNLYAVNLADGTQLWALQIGGEVDTNPLFDPGSGLVFTGTTGGTFYAIDPAQQTIKWAITFDQAQPGYTGINRPSVVGGTVFFAISVDNPSEQASEVYAVDISSGNTLWSLSFPTGVSAPIVTGDGLVFVPFADGTMRAFDQSTSDQLWSFQMSNITLGQPAYNNGWLYFGSLDGNFYAHASRPQPLKISQWAIAVNNDVPTGIALDNDDNAYFGGRDADGNGFFYVLDLTQAQNGNPQALTEGLEGQLLFTPDIAFNQIAFCAQGFFGGELIEIDLGILASASADAQVLPVKAAPRPPKQKSLDSAEVEGMLQMASFTSQLIVDEYDVSGTSAVPTTPAFQMMLSLFDENQAPQTSSNVSVWASEPITVTAGSQTYSIGTDATNPTVLPAGSAGQLTMSSAGSLGMANLFLAPDFFLPGFYLTVFPDTGNFNRMSNLQATDLDPTTALGYDSQPILLSNFQDQTSRTQIASSISNTVGRQPQSTATRTVAVMGSLTADAPPGRSYQPGDVPSFQVDFSSGISFSSLTSAQIAKSFGGPDGPGDFWLAGSFLGLDDFVNNIVKGVEKIGSIIWHFAQGVAGVIVHGAENLYQFTVETVDDAIQVAAGIWKQVVADVKHVIEWLSFLFDWQDIVKTHLLIKTQVLTTIKNFQTWIDGELNQTTNDVDTFFNARENDALTLFDQIISGLGGQTIDGVRQIGGDPNSAFSSQGQDVTTQANWLPRKLSDNAAGGSLSGVANAALFSATGDATVLSAIENFFSSIGNQIASDPALQSLPGDAQTALKNFSQLFTGSTGFTGQTLADVLAVVRDLVAGLIHLGKVAADGFLKLLQTIIDGIVSFLTGAIQIPFVSSFYKLIAQDDLSVISLFSLIAAVPTTIVYKLFTGSSPSDHSAALSAASTAVNVIGLANTFTLLLLLPLWIASDLGNFPPVLSGAIAGATAIQAALMLTLITLGGPNAPDYILWCAQFLSIILSVYGIWLGTAWAVTGPTLYGVYGFGMMIFYILYAALDPAKYFDPDSETFFANLSSALPYLGQPLSYIQVDEIGPAAVALVDTVGYGVSAALSTILFWTAPQTA